MCWTWTRDNFSSEPRFVSDARYNEVPPLKHHAPPLRRRETIRPPLLAIPSGHTIHTVDSTDDVQFQSFPRTMSGILITTTTRLEPDPLDTTAQPSEPALGTKESRRKKDKEKEEVAPSIVQVARQRARIHRKSRLMFIYPLVYTLMWLLSAPVRVAV
jgi:hypothetical protein